MIGSLFSPDFTTFWSGWLSLFFKDFITHNIYKIMSKRVRERDEDWLDLDSEKASRLLYPNPVCFLSTKSTTSSSSSKEKYNVMTSSWLTAANNNGGLVLVVNKARHSAESLREVGSLFTLSVATERQKELLVKVGKCSGRSVAKFSTIDGLQTIPTTFTEEPVAKSSSQGIISNSFSALEASSSDDDDEKKKEEETDTSEDYPPSIEGTVARMVCRVLNIHPAADEGHHLIVAQIEKAKVLKSYFSEGKFSPKGTAMRMESLPRLLTFLGGQTFGAVDADETKVVVQKSK